MKCSLVFVSFFFACSCNALGMLEPWVDAAPRPPVVADPCQSYLEENVWQRSTRHQMVATHTPRCDTHLASGWYRFTSKAGGKIRHQRISPGFCGTRRPIYIKSGTLPTTKDREVSLQACYDNDGVPCFETLRIKARFCQVDGKEYYIYFLTRPMLCASYCAGSEIPCPFGESSTTGFTINGKCNKLFPVFSTPRVHYVVKSNLLFFVCNFTTDATTVSDIFNILWYDSSHNTFRIEGTGNNFKEKMVIKWSVLEQNGRMKLGDTFFCTVQSWYQHSPRNTSPLTKSNHFFAGIRVRNRTIHLVEGKKDDVILVEATIPILCKPKFDLCGIKIHINNGKVESEETCFLRLFKKDSPQHKTLHISVPEKMVERPTEHSFISLTVNILGAMESWASHKKISDIQVITSDKKWGFCYSTGDPHITTFGSQYYHHYQVGDYQMVRTTNNAFEIHIRTWQCARVACNCGIAAREGEDIVVIDMCRDSIPRPRLPRKEEMERSDGTVVTVDSTGRLFTISFSSGATITFNTIYWSYGNTYFGDITVKLPPLYHGKTLGLCGTYDDQRDNELISRYERIWDSKLPSHRVAPKEFTESWRLRSDESLFYYKPKDKVCKRRTREKQYCKCEEIIIDGKVENKATCGALGEAAMFSANQKPLRFANEDICSRRKRRSVHRSGDSITIPDDDGSSDYVYDPTPLNITIPVWPTKTGKTQADVQKYCTDTIMNSQTGKMCQKLDSFDFSPTIDQCVEDIKVTDDFELVTSAIQSLAEKCKDDLISNVTYWSSDPSGNGTLSLPAEVFAISCPGLCSGKGTCVNGTCECFKGFSAPDCSVNITTGPTFRYIQNNGFCDIQKRSDCSRIRVIGRNFIASRNLSCRMTPIKMSNLSDSKTDKQIFTKATLLSFGEMTCDMVDNPVKSYTSSINGTPYVRFKVEVSNDGIIFSKQSHNYTIYDSKCINCTNNGTCQFQEGTCLINGYCFKNGESPSFSSCLRCEPSYNVSAFYPVKTGICATTTTAPSTSTVKSTSDRLPTREGSGNRTTTDRPSTNSEKHNVTTNHNNSTTKAHSKNETLKTTVSTRAKNKGKMATIISCSVVGGILILVFLIVCALKFKKAHTIKTYPVDPAELSNHIELQRTEDLTLAH